MSVCGPGSLCWLQPPPPITGMKDLSHWSRRHWLEGTESKASIYKCQAGPAALVKDNITELLEHLTKLEDKGRWLLQMWRGGLFRRHFIKCGQAAACQMIVFLHVGQVALPVISPDIHDANININRFSPSDKRMLGCKVLGTEKYSKRVEEALISRFIKCYLSILTTVSRHFLGKLKPLHIYHITYISYNNLHFCFSVMSWVNTPLCHKQNLQLITDFSKMFRRHYRFITELNFMVMFYAKAVGGLLTSTTINSDIK